MFLLIVERGGERNHIDVRNNDWLSPACPLMGTEPITGAWALTGMAVPQCIGQCLTTRATLARASLSFFSSHIGGEHSVIRVDLGRDSAICWSIAGLFSQHGCEGIHDKGLPLFLGVSMIKHYFHAVEVSSNHTHSYYLWWKKANTINALFGIEGA